MNRIGIQNRVYLVALLLAIAISLFLGSYFVNTRIREVEQSFADRGRAIAHRLALAAVYDVGKGDITALQRLVRETLGQPGVHAVSILD